MNQTFWTGFADGYANAAEKVYPLVLAAIVGAAFGQYFHPYEQCSRQFTDTATVVECVKQKRLK